KKQEVPLQIPNTYSSQMGTLALSNNPAFVSQMKKRLPIRGLVVDGDKLRGIVVSHPQLSLQSVRIPYIRVVSNDLGGGIARTEYGGTVTVQGEGFMQNLNGENPLQIRLGNEVVNKDVKVGEDGIFVVQLNVNRMPGDYSIEVE